MTQTWLITGANRGIGLELVRQLAEAAENVIATARSPEQATELNTIKSAYPSVTVLPLDLEDLSSVKRMADSLKDVPIDILFNNAGLYGGSWDNASDQQSAANMDFGLWEQIMRVNVLAPFAVIQALRANLMLGKRKLVVNMSSDLGSITNNLQGQSYAYRSSKAALNMVTKGLSVELAADGVTVIAMAPGWTQTDLGGQHAQWPVEESVANQLRVLRGISASDNGRFVNLLGETVPW